MKTLYEYRDYKQFLRDRISEMPHQGRGLRKRLAEALKCQNTFISHVLSGNYHFSLEQAERVADFLGLTRAESEYFILLISFNRAGSRELTSFMEAWLESHREKDLELKSRLRIKSTLSHEDQALYMSSAIYALVHSALTIPKLRTASAIAARLKVDEKEVREVLRFLTSRRLVKETDGQVYSVSKEFHFDRRSPFLKQHHRNFRVLAINACETQDDKNLHYSAVVSCSRSDLEKIRRRLVKAIEEAIDEIRPSPEEEMAVFNVDWFTAK